MYVPYVDIDIVHTVKVLESNSRVYLLLHTYPTTTCSDAFVVDREMR